MNRRTGNRWTGNRRTGNRRMRKRRTGLQKDNEGRKDKEQVNRKLSESFELGNRRTENIRAYMYCNTCIYIGKWSKIWGNCPWKRLRHILSKPG